jgi:hypothetical protein
MSGGEVLIPIIASMAGSMANKGMSKALGEDETSRALNDPEQVNRDRNKRLSDWVSQMQQQTTPTQQPTTTIDMPSLQELLNRVGGA